MAKSPTLPGSRSASRSTPRCSAVLSYWITPAAAIILVDWYLRERLHHVVALMQFSQLPLGVGALVALAAGFIASLPFQASTIGLRIADATGLPVNAISQGPLPGADLGYLVGFGVAAMTYVAVVRRNAQSQRAVRVASTV